MVRREYKLRNIMIKVFLPKLEISNDYISQEMMRKSVIGTQESRRGAAKTTIRLPGKYKNSYVESRTEERESSVVMSRSNLKFEPEKKQPIKNEKAYLEETRGLTKNVLVKLMKGIQSMIDSLEDNNHRNEKEEKELKSVYKIVKRVPKKFAYIEEKRDLSKSTNFISQLGNVPLSMMNNIKDLINEKMKQNIKNMKRRSTLRVTIK